MVVDVYPRSSFRLNYSFFTAQHLGRAVLAMSEMSVRPSVWQTSELWQNRKNSAHILTPHERVFILVTWHEERFVGDDHFYLKLWAKLTPFKQKRRFSIVIRS